MSVAVLIKDETSTGKIIGEQILRFPAERITVKQIIEQRIESEVEKYNANNAQAFWGLIQPNDSEQELNGFKIKKRKSVDAETQKQLAIQAFQSNGFFLLVNDKQLTELDDEILITPKTSVLFIKLVPLIGG
jgi:hypothetical protein